MKILVTGANGLLGTTLVNTLRDKGFNVAGADLPVWNILDPSFENFVETEKPTHLINCAAFTDVPLAEKEKEQAMAINVQAVEVLAKLSLQYNFQIIHFSTDFVFDGDSQHPYTEDTVTCPVNFYGLTKLLGEKTLQRVLKDSKNFTIFRLQWLFGHNSKTFFSKIFDKACLSSNPLSIVSDEIGSPCSVQFVSDTLCGYLAKNPVLKGELYHLTHDDFCSRFECAKFFLDSVGFKDRVVPVENLVTDLARPKFGALNNTKLQKQLGRSLGSWQEDILLYIREIEHNIRKINNA